MSLGNGLFWLCCAVVLLCLFAPVRLRFTIRHQTQWSVMLTIRFLWWERIVHDGDSLLLQNFERKIEQHSAIVIDWKGVILFGRKMMDILVKYIRLEQLSIECCIGWARADYTAYSYGLFWAMVSALPVHWLEKSDIVYEPNFQMQCKEIAIEGIIRSTAAQFIAILAALYWLMARELQQIRKEQMTA